MRIQVTKLLLFNIFFPVLNVFNFIHFVMAIDLFTDISIAVIDLLQEMTDVDTLNESEEGAAALIDALVSFEIFEFVNGLNLGVSVVCRV